ncbi:MAG: pre-peptidase C-terminal domain-containing protein [Cyanobacteria bacterium P01_F01_bin.53]
MKSNKGPLANVLSSAITGNITKGLLAAAVLTGVAGIAHRAALAQALLQQQGTLAPMADSYTFDGEAGQSMTIELQSEDFDTTLLLKGPDGEDITSNDDYGGTLNSTIVIELPESGTYSAVASSFSGEGGNYQIEVRPSSEYEVVFSRAFELSVSEDYAEAIEAYTAAIVLDETDPAAYLGRAESTVNEAYISSTVDITDLSDLPEDVTDAVVEDYLKAADLLDQQGQAGPAASLREQAQYFSGEAPTAESNSPFSESEAPEVGSPEVELPNIVAPEAEGSIPVESDGGIGDGAEPLPEDAE